MARVSPRQAVGGLGKLRYEVAKGVDRGACRGVRQGQDRQRIAPEHQGLQPRAACQAQIAQALAVDDGLDIESGVSTSIRTAQPLSCLSKSLRLLMVTA